MDSIDAFHRKFVEILADYYATYSIAPIVPNLVITEDMSNACRNLRPDLIYSHPGMLSIESFNAVTVPPDSIDGTFTILMNQKILVENLQKGNANWVGTIAHEMTHIVDFIDYAKILGTPNYDDFQLIDHHPMFSLWTEFNARAKGYYFVRKYTFRDLYAVSQVPDIINYELKAQTELLLQNCRSTDNSYRQAYYISHYLGRLYTLQKLFPSQFSDNYIESMDILSSNPWISEWFHFLKNHASLDAAYPDFPIMHDILKKNYPDL